MKKAVIGGIVWYSWGFSAAFGAKDPGQVDSFIGFRKYLFCITGILYFASALMMKKMEITAMNSGFSNLLLHVLPCSTAATIVSGSIAERAQISDPSLYRVFSLYDWIRVVYPVVVALRREHGPGEKDGLIKWASKILHFPYFAGSGVFTRE